MPMKETDLTTKETMSTKKKRVRKGYEDLRSCFNSQHKAVGMVSKILSRKDAKERKKIFPDKITGINR